MFKKILIANRGEIACRIMRTCKSLGISTVAVFSEVDANAPHVLAADEAYPIGESRVSESYLNIERILCVALESNVDAVHPGYGLLSENPLFAARCIEEGIVFIGPSPQVIAAMGNKIEARKLMQQLGVPVVPGVTHPLSDTTEALEVAKKIGYPVMLKASAGGGGIGLQVIYDEEGLNKAFHDNQRKVTTFFGDGDMFIEKYIQNPRHIEIQVLVDQTGNALYLGERECSIQRRHQKVIEEAPSSFINEEIRRKMGETAIKISKEIGYSNAGTIEFLMDENKNYYFLEMNTRLQVEHPVTEEIIGLDIVEKQIEIAAGKKLQLKQQDIQLCGHAIEVRIFAEDPVAFYPSPGKITKLELPKGDYLRHELAIESGSRVSTFYDPMIAKLIVKSKDRKTAIERLSNALSTYYIEGIKTNIPFLIKIINHDAFKCGNTTTNFIEKHFKNISKS